MKKSVVSCWLLMALAARGLLAAEPILPDGDYELPDGFVAKDSLEVPRGQYINTGYKPNQDTSVKMKVHVNGDTEYWFGCWSCH